MSLFPSILKAEKQSLFSTIPKAEKQSFLTPCATKIH